MRKIETIVTQSPIANTYGAWSLVHQTSDDALITHVCLSRGIPEPASVNLGVGEPASETVVGIVDFASCPAIAKLEPPIPVPKGAHLAVRVASEVSQAITWGVVVAFEGELDADPCHVS